MAGKCENRKCATGKGTDVILYLPAKTSKGVVLERRAVNVCAACAMVLWKDDDAAFRPMTKSEKEAAAEAARAHPEQSSELTV